MTALSPARSLVAGVAAARANGWKQPLKVAVRTRDGAFLQYIEGPDGAWEMHGNGMLTGRRYRRKFRTLRALDKYVEALRPDEVSLRRRKPRVVAVGRLSDLWRLELLEVGEIVRRVGEDTFAAFMKCFVGADRLKSLFHYYDAAKHKHGDTSPAGQRNFHTHWLLVVASMHEIGIALNELNATKAHLKLRGQSWWRPLERLRRKWHNHPVVGRIRNQAGFHLGKLESYKVGIAKLTERCLDAPLRVGQGRRPMQTFARGPLDMLFLGFSSKDDKYNDLAMAEIQKVLRTIREGHNVLHRGLEAYFLRVLRHAGVGLTRHMTE
jgi:hypothetical protein